MRIEFEMTGNTGETRDQRIWVRVFEGNLLLAEKSYRAHDFPLPWDIVESLTLVVLNLPNADGVVVPQVSTHELLEQFRMDCAAHRPSDFWSTRAVLEIACQLERLEVTLRLAAIETRERKETRE